MKQKWKRLWIGSIVAILLVGGLLSFLSSPAHAQQYDITVNLPTDMNTVKGADGRYYSRYATLTPSVDLIQFYSDNAIDPSTVESVSLVAPSGVSVSVTCTTASCNFSGPISGTKVDLISSDTLKEAGYFDWWRNNPGYHGYWWSYDLEGETTYGEKEQEKLIDENHSSIAPRDYPGGEYPHTWDPLDGSSKVFNSTGGPYTVSGLSSQYVVLDTTKPGIPDVVTDGNMTVTGINIDPNAFSATVSTKNGTFAPNSGEFIIQEDNPRGIQWAYSFEFNLYGYTYVYKWGQWKANITFKTITSPPSSPPPSQTPSPTPTPSETITGDFTIEKPTMTVRESNRITPIGVSVSGGNGSSLKELTFTATQGSNSKVLYTTNGASQDYIYQAPFPSGFGVGPVQITMKITSTSGSSKTIGPKSFNVTDDPTNRPPTLKVAWVKSSSSTSAVDKAIVGDKLYFKILSVSDPDGDPVTTIWDMASSSSWVKGLPAKYGWDAPLTNKWYGPITMDEAGMVKVSAKAVDSWGKANTDNAVVFVDSPNPIPKITGATTVKEGHVLNPLLSSEKSYTNVPGRTIDHSRDIWTNKKDSYDVAGTEKVYLDVFDNTGLKSLAPDVHTITVVPDQPPTPDFEYNSTMVRNRAYSLQNLSRSDDGDQIEIYQVSWGYDAWNNGDIDPTENVISASNNKFEFTPSLVGRYRFRVYAKEVDYNGHTGKSAYKEYTVDVINDNPEATFTVSGVFPDPKPPRIVQYNNTDFFTANWSLSKGRGKGSWFLSKEGNLMSPPIWNKPTDNKGSFYTVRSDSQLTYKGQLTTSAHTFYYGRLGTSNVFLGRATDDVGYGNIFIETLGGARTNLTSGLISGPQASIREDLGEVLVYWNWDIKVYREYTYEAQGSRYKISDLVSGVIHPTSFSYKVNNKYYADTWHTTVTGNFPSFSNGTSPLLGDDFIRFREDYKRIDATNRKIYSYKLDSLNTPYSTVDYTQIPAQGKAFDQYERFPNEPVMSQLNFRDNYYNYYVLANVGSDSTPLSNYANDIKSYYRFIKYDGATGMPQYFGDIISTSKSYEQNNGITNPSYFEGMNSDRTLLAMATYVFDKLLQDSDGYDYPTYKKVYKYLDIQTGQILNAVPAGKSTWFSLTPDKTFDDKAPISDGLGVTINYTGPKYCVSEDSDGYCDGYDRNKTRNVTDLSTRTSISTIPNTSPLAGGVAGETSPGVYLSYGGSFVSAVFDEGVFKSYTKPDLPQNEKYFITPSGKVYDITQDDTPTAYSSDFFSLGNWINPQSERISSGTIRWSQKFNSLPLNGLSAGMNFRIVDGNNMYRLEVDKHKIKLSKIAGGIKTVLMEAVANHVTGQWYDYEIKLNGNSIRVYEKGALAMPEVINSEFAEGTIGPYAIAESVEFKGISLQLSGNSSEYEAQGYALVDAQTRYTTTYSDPENDPVFEAGTQWTYSHIDPNMFLDYGDGKSGLSTLHGQTRTSPNLVFDRVGSFKITYRVPDDPHPYHLQRNGDTLFSSYAKYSTDYSKLLVVHRRPISLFTLSLNGDGTVGWNDQSYDPDRCYNANSCQSGYQTSHGIMAKGYYYITPSGNTVYGKLVRPPEAGTYTVAMQVEDYQYAKSDWYQQTITVFTALPNGPPSVTLTYPTGTQANPTFLNTVRPTISWSQSDPNAGTIFDTVNIIIKDETGNVVIQRNGIVQQTTSTTNTWTVDQDLPVSTKFQVQVQVSDGDLTSAWSNVGWMKTNSTPTAALTFPNGARNMPSIVTTSTPEIRWNQYDPDAGTVYTSADVWIQDDSDQTFILRNVPMNTTQGSWQWTIDQAMTPGSLYQVKVRVYDQLGAVSPWSNIGWIRVNNSPAAVMTYPSGTYENPSMGNPTPLITWTQTDPDPNATFTKYRLLVREESATVSYVDTTVEVNTQSTTGGYQVTDPLPAGIKVRVTVMVWDQYNASSPWATETWMLTNRPPTADFDWSPKPVWEGDTVHLMDLSSDPDGDVLTYLWEVIAPDGAALSYNTTDVTADFLFAGPYTVKLTVSDGKAASQMTKVITAQPLDIQSEVEHTPEWLANHQRLNHNTTVRPIDFYSGEIFVVHTRSSPVPVTKAEAWIDTVGIDGNELSIQTALVQSSNDNTLFTGEIFDDRLLSLTKGLPNGNQTVYFRITYTNGVIKEEEVPVMIIGNAREFVQVHRVK